MRPIPSLEFLGQQVRVLIDRPLGSRHPIHGFLYPVNYGHVPGTTSGDGEELDAYVLGIGEAVAEFTGECIGVVRRDGEKDDKLIIVPAGTALSDATIQGMIAFQERAGAYLLVRS